VRELERGNESGIESYRVFLFIDGSNVCYRVLEELMLQDDTNVSHNVLNQVEKNTNFAF